MIADDLNRFMPEGWKLTHLINLEGEWQANICDDEFVVVATGKEIEEAVYNAAQKTYNESSYTGRLFHLGAMRLEKPNRPPLSLSDLGITLQAIEPLNRRF